MERHEVLEMMSALELSGMHAAFDGSWPMGSSAAIRRSKS